MNQSNKFKSIEVNFKKNIAKINDENMYPFQNWIKIRCFKGEWSVEENIDVFLLSRKK